MDQNREMQTLAGVVEHIIYINEHNGYAVFRLAADDDRSVVAVGSLPFLGVGESLDCEGLWVRHPSHGEQFKISRCDRYMPADELAILDYLSEGNVPGIGPVTAERIVEAFGTSAFAVLEQHPEKLATVQGITKAKAQKMSESFRRQLGVRRLMEYLSEYQIPARIAMLLYKWYGESAAGFIQENPYLLADESIGVRFETADHMAAELGFDADSPCRVDAGVLFELEHNTRNGHVFLPRDKLAMATAHLLGVPEALCHEAIDRLREAGKLVMEPVANVMACYTARLHTAEQGAAQRLRHMAGSPPAPDRGLEQLIDRSAETLGLTYTPLQREAITAAARHRVMLLTGGPGTGKTTSVHGMVALFEHMELDVMLCSPTGRAAKRLAELCGREAMTIHRLLEVDMSADEAHFRFVHDENNPLGADVVILDEASMVDVVLFDALTRALKSDARLIVVGDADQLPSVGPGGVLRDLMASGRVKTVCLDEIFRQAQASNIVVGAHLVNRGMAPPLGEKQGDLFFMRRSDAVSIAETIVGLAETRLPRVGYDPAQIQVLSPTRRGEAGTVSLNLALQQALNPPAAGKAERKFGNYTFRTGDRVMHIRNNYDLKWRLIDGSDSGMGVFNGDVGTILAIDPRAEQLSVAYDERVVDYSFEQLEELELSYAMTVHKSQGSEYRAVILALPRAPEQLLIRQILYTAMTRAREFLVMVGDERVLMQMVENNRRASRYSGLRYRLEKRGETKTR